MNEHLEIPEKTFALVYELANRGEKVGRNLNRSDVSNLIFIMQEKLGAPTTYNFELSSEGPFSADLISDLDLADSLGAISVRGEIKCLKPAEQSRDYVARNAEFIKASEASLGKITSDFLILNPTDAALRATILYSVQHFSSVFAAGTESVFRVIQEMKPLMPSESIIQAVDDLRKKGYLEEGGKKQESAVVS